MPVAVAIRAVFEDVAGQHLHHADLARPGTGGARRVEIAAAEQFHRRQHLRSEQAGPAAIMRQRHQRVAGVVIALEAAVIRLEGPERQQDAARHADLGLDPVEDAGLRLGLPAAVDQPVLADQGARELDEILLEKPLRPVGADHLGILPHPGEEGVDGAA